MAYDKTKLYRLTHRLYKELKDQPHLIHLKKLNGSQGEYHYDTSQVFLDYRRTLIPTLIHEYLHKWNPDKCETWVLKEESLIMNALSQQQVLNILKALSEAVNH